MTVTNKVGDKLGRGPTKLAGTKCREDVVGGKSLAGPTLGVASKYADIINHPHYEPKRHPRMPRSMRAAQFAPFAALSGHAGAVRRTAKFAELKSQRVIDFGAYDDMEFVNTEDAQDE